MTSRWLISKNWHNLNTVVCPFYLGIIVILFIKYIRPWLISITLTNMILIIIINSGLFMSQFYCLTSILAVHCWTQWQTREDQPWSFLKKLFIVKIKLFFVYNSCDRINWIVGSPYKRKRLCGFPKMVLSRALNNDNQDFRRPGPDFIIKDLPSVLILLIADQHLNDSLCCSNKYNWCLCRSIGKLYIML